MSGFGAKARQFMGWYTPEEVDESTLDFLPEEFEETEVAHITPTPASNVTPIHREERRSSQQADLSRIVTVRPLNYNDAPAIAEPYRDGIPVIMNLSEVSDKDAQRFIDLAGGLTYGLQGVFERVTDRVFLLSPTALKLLATSPAPIVRLPRSSDADNAVPVVGRSDCSSCRSLHARADHAHDF